MSLIPAFEIGLWNAWIFMLYFPLHPVIMLLIDKLVGVGNVMGSVPYNKTERIIMNSSMILLCLAFIYSIFLPLKLGTVWLYIGLLIHIFGLIMFILAIASIATTPHGEPFTKGNSILQ